MTDNDFRVETLLAIIALTASTTLLLTWKTADSQTATIMTGAVYLLTAMWLAIRFLPRDDEDTTRQH